MRHTFIAPAAAAVQVNSPASNTDTRNATHERERELLIQLD
jgi:hypothetical protein